MASQSIYWLLPGARLKSIGRTPVTTQRHNVWGNLFVIPVRLVGFDMRLFAPPNILAPPYMTPKLFP